MNIFNSYIQQKERIIKNQIFRHLSNNRGGGAEREDYTPTQPHASIDKADFGSEENVSHNYI